ncbi:MAG: glutamyl-tRNA reductase [Anaerolineaceae bacterium]|nr:glutamyl-tRNA reductase [Anaerolineaceae bacterium]
MKTTNITRFSVIGLSHRTAPVDVREQFALGGALARRLLDDLHQENVFAEALILDTCNRTEVYFVDNSAAEPLDYLLDHIARLKNTRATSDRSAFYRHDGLAAVEHLFRVSASLDSQIVGEQQILGQVKEAYRVALEARMARFLLNKMMHAAFRVGKRVQSETELGRGSASVAQAAVELARQIFSSLEGLTVLLVGAGQTAEAAARALLRTGVSRLIVANRTPQRAARLAKVLLKPGADKDDALQESEEPTCPALSRQDDGDRSAVQPPPLPREKTLATEVITLEDIPSVIATTDLMITSTGSPQPVLTYKALARGFRRSGRSQLVIDIAVPRDVEPRLGRLDNVFLYNIDDLDRLVNENLDRRRQEIPRVEAIIEDEVQQFTRWLDALQVTPTIQLLREHLEALQRLQIDRYCKQFSQADREKLAQFTNTLCNKILHQPLTFLRRLTEEGSASEVLATTEIIRQMFGLDSREQR